jgi:C-terminal processing protease CtpA/Prc
MSRLPSSCVVLIVLMSLGASQSKEAPKPKPGYIGIQIAEGEQKGSIVVRTVQTDSPAEKAGLKGGDRLIRIDDATPTDIPSAVMVVRTLKPGKKVKLLILRDGKEKTLEVVPIEVPR